MKQFLALLLALPMAASADYIDTTGPTGHYYQYAGFTTATSEYKGGGDVDSYGDLIYVNRDGTNLDVYQVTLLDSDGDGVLEPDQHPLNIGPNECPNEECSSTTGNQGPMEQRILTYVTTYSVPELDYPTVGEIYAAADRVYFLGEDQGDIYEYVFATDVTSKVVDSAYFNLSHLGYDDVNGKWYASREWPRAVYSWDGSSWQFEFEYASLAGGHMDGMEVITDPCTGTPYVYVSDMTSDYIGQWKYDSTTSSWVEENLFTYVGTYGYVEGMGFGALGHIWVTTGFSNSGTLYELGGGKLSCYLPKLCPEEPGTRTMGFYKNHSCVVDMVLPIIIADEEINDVEDAIAIIKDRGDHWSRLLSQLMVTKLNVAVFRIGCCSMEQLVFEGEETVNKVITAAEELLAEPGATKDELSAMQELLDIINNSNTDVALPDNMMEACPPQPKGKSKN